MHEPSEHRKIQKKISRRAWYLANRDEILAKKKAYYENNKFKERARNREYNKTKYASRQRLNNRARNQHVSRTANLGGKWDHETSIIYEQCARLRATTGIDSVVDHVWPLKGKNSCGLHVPWNLRIITREENTAKGNKEPDQ